MRFGFLIILVIWINLLSAQDKSYRIDATNADLVTILDQLQKDYQLLFTYEEALINSQETNAVVEANSIEALLTQLLYDGPVGFKIVDEKFVNLFEKPLIANRICGHIKDEFSGAPLQFANVFISQLGIGASTDSLGFFEIAYPFYNKEILNLSYVGYQDQSIALGYFLSSNCASVKLKINENAFPYLLIKDYITDGISLSDNGSNTKIDFQKTGLFPGRTNSDALEIIQFLPGVNTLSSKMSELYVRGSTPDQTLVLWEDIPMYHLGHYFGMVSSINAGLIDEVNVYRGGFGADFGGRVAGVVDIKSLDEDNTSFISLEADMTNLGIRGHQHLGNKKQAAVNFSFRRSYSELLQTPTLDRITNFNQQGFIVGSQELISLPDHIRSTENFDFLDSNFKISTKLGNKDRFSIATIYAKNNFSNLIEDDRMEETQIDSFNLKSFGVNVKWRRQFNSNWSSLLKLTSSFYSYDYDYALFDDRDGDIQLSGLKFNEIRDDQIEYVLNYANDQNQLFSLGYNFTNYNVLYEIEEDTRGNNDVDDRRDDRSALHTLYFNFKNPIDNRLGINIGLRTNYFSVAESFYFEPRVRLAYKLNTKQSLSFNYGMHNQFLSQIKQYRGSDSGFDLPIWSLAERNIPVQTAHHFQLGNVNSFNKWIIDFQIYYRRINGINSRAFDLEIGNTNGEQELGYSTTRGMDIMITKQLKKVKSWLSYSYIVNELHFNEILKQSFNSDFDRRHTVQWVNQLTSGVFQFALGLKYGSGLPYSRIVDFEVTSMPNEPFSYRAIYDGVNNQRLPMTLELNLSMGYKIKSDHQDWTADIRVSAMNVLNRNNLYNRNYYVRSRKDDAPSISFRDKSNLFFTPNLNVLINW